LNATKAATPKLPDFSSPGCLRVKARAPSFFVLKSRYTLVMLYTKKGDKGTTKTLRSDDRIPKNSSLINALGTVDELNAWLGLVKSEVKQENFEVAEMSLKVYHLLDEIQNDLFTIQAHLAGAGLTINEPRIAELERITDEIEKMLPPIKSFFVPGGCRLSAMFDVGRTIARRAERMVIEAGVEHPLGETITPYLNRLSSALYALTRLSNHKFGITEEPPTYNRGLGEN
jgi:cob(I)alamin adenosyltransferase